MSSSDPATRRGWLDGHVAIVTGAAQGIGAAVVRRFLAEGAAGVVAVDRSATGLQQLVAHAPQAIVAIEGDVREADTHARAVACAQARFGRLDVLVPNAGVFDFRRPLRSYDAATLVAAMDELFAINLRGYLLAVLEAREALVAQHGSVVVTASVASHHAGGGGILYTMGKHALVGMVRQLALELAPDVRVNGVAPGGTLTALSGMQALGQAGRRIGADPAAFDERIARAVPLGFAQRPEDHTSLYVLLASRAHSPAVTGEILMSDGGVGARSI